MASRSALLTVLFTDIVGSTEIAKEMGDRRWRELLARHHRVVRRELKRFGGREVDTAGDGFFAVFDRPEDAVRCATAISDAVRELGIEIRAGVHAGQVELTGRRVGGVAVHVGARIGAQAGPGEVLVSATLRDLLPGAVLSFEDRGSKDLKGVPEPQRVYAVAAVQGRPRAGALDEDEARRRRETVEHVEGPTPAARRRRRLQVGALAAVVVSAVVVAVALTRQDLTPPPAETEITLGTVVRIDPQTNRVAGSIPRLPPRLITFLRPSLEVGEGGIWVIGAGGLRHVDPDSREVTLVAIGTAFPSDIAIGHHRAWVAVAEANRVIGVSPGSLEVADVTRLPVPVGVIGSSSITVTREAVWTASQRTLFRIEPGTREVRPFSLPLKADDIVESGGDVWIADQLENTLLRFDPDAGRVAGTTELQTLTPDEIVADEGGELWILDKFARTVARLSPDGELDRPIPVGGDPTALAAGEDAVWVADGDGHLVRRIDPDLGSIVATIDVGGPAQAVAVDPDSGEVWVYLAEEGA